MEEKEVTIYRKFVDVTARKPSGWLGRRMYSNPRGHYRAFHRILEKLDLQSDDRYLELACGGGRLLKMVLKTVESAAAIDHSSDMVCVASEQNREAIAAHRLDIREGDVHSLPWRDNSFSCAACSEAFFFFPEPEGVLAEILRVLEPGGRVAIAMPVMNGFMKIFCFPWVSQMRLYSDDEMVSIMKNAGFGKYEVNSVSDMIQLTYGVK